MKFKSLILSITLFASFAGVRAMDNEQNNNQQDVSKQMNKVLTANLIVMQNPNHQTSQEFKTTFENTLNEFGFNKQNFAQFVLNTFAAIKGTSQSNSLMSNALVSKNMQTFNNFLSHPALENACNNIINSQNQLNNNNEENLNNEEYLGLDILFNQNQNNQE